MRAEEARILLGFPPNYRPTPFQVKAAYRKKVWDSHPDLFPRHEKCNAESKFKLISEAYTCLQSWFPYDGGYEEEEFRETHMPDALHGFALQSIPCIPRREMDSRGEGAGAGAGCETIVVRTGVASVPGGRRNHALIGVPFIFIILGTVALGGLNATRAYRKQQETYPSHNPFLP